MGQSFSRARKRIGSSRALLVTSVSLWLSALGAGSCAPPSLDEYAVARAGNAGASEVSGSANGGAGVSGSSFAGSGGASAGGTSGVGGSASAAGTTNTSGSTSIGDAGNDAGTGCMPEICNGLDDDCDHVIDNGCPTGFQRGAAAPGMTLGDSTGGSAFSETCSDDEVLVGMQLGFSNWLDQITFKCQAFSLATSTKSIPYQYSVALGASHLLPAHPATTSDSLQTLNCPSGQILVGLAIAEQHTAPQFSPDYIVLTSISATCAELVLDSSVDPPVLAWQNSTSIGPISGTLYDNTSATSASLTLMSNQIAVGYQGFGGAWIDRVGATTSTVQVLLE